MGLAHSISGIRALRFFLCRWIELPSLCLEFFNAARLSSFNPSNKLDDQFFAVTG